MHIPLPWTAWGLTYYCTTVLLYGCLTFLWVFVGVFVASWTWQQIHVYSATCAGLAWRFVFMTHMSVVWQIQNVDFCLLYCNLNSNSECNRRVRSKIANKQIKTLTAENLQGDLSDTEVVRHHSTGGRVISRKLFPCPRHNIYHQ